MGVMDSCSRVVEECLRRTVNDNGFQRRTVNPCWSQGLWRIVVGDKPHHNHDHLHGSPPPIPQGPYHCDPFGLPPSAVQLFCNRQDLAVTYPVTTIIILSRLQTPWQSPSQWSKP